MATTDIVITMSAAEAGLQITWGDKTTPMKVPITSELLQDVEQMMDGDASIDDVQNVGTRLSALAISGELRSYLLEEAENNDLVRIRLMFDAESRHLLAVLPWESLRVGVREREFLVWRPKVSLIRHVEVTDRKFAKLPKKPKDDHIHILVIAPAGKDLSTDEEIREIESAAKLMASPEKCHVTCLQGRVTGRDIGNALASQPFDIVHYIGHGIIENGWAQIYLHDDGANTLYASADNFVKLIQRAEATPRLIFLNCCASGAAKGGMGLRGVGERLADCGVPAVIAMQFNILDLAAKQFSSDFYKALLGSKVSKNRDAVGRVDLAVNAARFMLDRVQTPAIPENSFVAPVLFLSADQHQIFELSETESIVPPPLISQWKPRQPELIDAIKDGSLIVIAGPGLLSLKERPPVESMRSGAGLPEDPLVTPLPLEIARTVAEKLDPAARAELALKIKRAETLREHWSTESLLRAGTLRMAAGDAQRTEVALEVQKLYSHVHCPPILARLLNWTAPVVYYTHIDGLVEQQIRKDTASRRVLLNAFHAKPVDLLDHQRMVVLAAGSINEPGNMVLTESDAEDLLRSTPDQKVIEQVKRLKRRVLFIGVHPFDPIAKALGKQLLMLPGQRQSRPFFLWEEEPSASQRAYWKRYDMQWENGPLAEAFAVLDNSLPS